MLNILIRVLLRAIANGTLVWMLVRQLTLIAYSIVIFKVTIAQVTVLVWNIVRTDVKLRNSHSTHKIAISIAYGKTD